MTGWEDDEAGDDTMDDTTAEPSHLVYRSQGQRKAANGAGRPRDTGRTRADGSHIWEWWVYDPTTRDARHARGKRVKLTGHSEADCLAQAATKRAQWGAEVGANLATAGRTMLETAARRAAEETVAYQLDRWLADLGQRVAAGTRSPNTLRSAERVVAVVTACPVFGRDADGLVRARDLRGADLLAFREWLALPGRRAGGGRLAPASITAYLKLFQAALTWARKQGYPAPAQSPFLGLALEVAGTPAVAAPLDYDDLRALVWDTRYGPLLLLLATLGLRLGEGLAICEQDLTVTGGRVKLRLWRQVRHERDRGLCLAPLKGRNRPRTLVVPQLGQEALAEVRRRLAVQRGRPVWDPAVARPWDAEGLLLRARTGNAVFAADVRVHYARALAAAGLDPTTPHKLRHGFVTTQIGLGHPIAVVSRHIGHASIAMTDRIYNHVDPEEHPELAESIDRLTARTGDEG